MPHTFDRNGCWVPIETHADVANIREQFRQRQAREHRIRSRNTTALFALMIAALIVWTYWDAAADIGRWMLR